MGNKSSGMILLGTVLAAAVFLFLAFGSSVNAGSGISFKGRVENTTLTTTIAQVITTSSSPAFRNGSIVTLITYSNSSCYPSLTALFPGSAEAANAAMVTGCEVGDPVNETFAVPRWNLIPSFAGMSIYGITAWGATPQGYPVYNGAPVVTQCGAAGTPSACANLTKLFYSVKQGTNERALGIYGGIAGLPEGVLPNPANDKLLSSNKTGKTSPSFLVRISVYDPNIFPNATTGKCTQVVPSNLSNPTGDCLTTYAALKNALVTMDSAVAAANGNNLLWNNAGKPLTQVALLSTLNISVAAKLNLSNTNLVSYSYASSTPSYPVVQPVVTTTVATTVATTIAPVTTVAATNSTSPATTGSGSNTALYAAIAVVIIIVVLAAWYLMSRKK